MPGSEREVANAEEEGVEFVWLSAPESFTADKHVKQVAVAGMRLGAPDASGRRSPEADPGRKFDVPADMVIKALGFDPEALPHLFGSPDLSVRSEEHTSELQSLMRISYAVFCLK